MTTDLTRGTFNETTNENRRHHTATSLLNNKPLNNELFFLSPQTEFLNISFTKNSSALLHAIPSPFYWQIFKNHNFLWFYKSLQKIRETGQLESIHELAFC